MTAVQLQKYFEAESTWVFAKSMPKFPHYYIVREKINNDQLFNEIVDSLRKNGQPRRWHGREFIYFDAGRYTYWTMGADISDTRIINRAEIDN